MGLKPHMDVITHHTTVAGDFAMTRPQWLIKRTARTADRSKCITTAWKFTANCPMALG
jgi:hypothetical protein